MQRSQFAAPSRGDQSAATAPSAERRVAVHRKHQATPAERDEWRNYYTQIFNHVRSANERLCQLYRQQHDVDNSASCTNVLQRFEQMLDVAEHKIWSAMQTEDESLIAATVFANIKRLEADESLVCGDVHDPAATSVRVKVIALPQNITTAMVEQADTTQS